MSETAVPFREAVAVWWRLGLLGFGGPAGQIAMMHRVVVDEKRWLDEPRFLHALNYCMLLPGPEAQQLATYIGWLLHGVKGGVVAGLLFIIPGALAILALSTAYVLAGGTPWVEGLFFGLKAAVIAIVVQALIRIARRALSGVLHRWLALGAFLALAVLSLPFPLVILAAGLAGWWGGGSKSAASPPPLPVSVPQHPGTRRAALVALIAWLAPVALLAATLGRDHVFSQISVFFSKMAVLTFGGAYAVLAYVAQQGVEHYAWLAPGEMLDGLGLAETTPGPLILVTQFVGFLAAWRHGAAEPSLAVACMGAALTTWVTFLPCFVWIFAGAPHVERLRSNARLSAAMAGITAAVVGVIANLAFWFARNAWFSRQIELPLPGGTAFTLPDFASVDPVMVGLSAVAGVLLFAFRLGLASCLAVCALLGLLLHGFSPGG